MAAPGLGSVLAATAMMSVALAGGTAPGVDARAPAVKPTQTLAALSTSHKVVWSLDARGARGDRVHASRPITGERTVLPVLARRTTKDGIRWLLVRVPGRPNGRKGWIARRGTVLTSTSWRIVIRTASRRVLVYRRGRLVRTFAAVVGKPSTPTPNGPFFVEEGVRMGGGSVGGPYALALSARSNVLQEFAGGPGQVAMHGVANLGGTPGTAVSHGCVRLANRDITWLAFRIGPGVPVTIRR
jgi:lipoprotein-anchoring transpeptidase ErfK/SrfK